jgi:hypothetical protein
MESHVVLQLFIGVNQRARCDALEFHPTMGALAAFTKRPISKAAFLPAK